MKAAEVNNVAVIGAGTMGPGIAQSFAHKDMSVRLFDLTPDRCAAGLEAIKANLRAYDEHGLLKPGEADAVLSRLSVTTSMESACADVDFVVEAVGENLDLKKELFGTLDRHCPERTILASNTSGLSITAMGAATSRPDRVVGAHYWNPPHLVPLVEVVRGEKTSDRTMDLTFDLMTRIDKKPVRVNREVPGFIGTRLHQALIREAFYIVEEGIASPEDVDRVVETSFGRRLAVTGPFATCDLGGLDIFLAAAEVWRDLSNAGEPSRLLAESVSQGHLGAKTGRGLLAWDPDSMARKVKERMDELMHYLKIDLDMNEDGGDS